MPYGGPQMNSRLPLPGKHLMAPIHPGGPPVYPFVRRKLENDTNPNSESVTAAAPSKPTSLRRRLVAQLASFGAVGALAYVVDLTVYNVVRATILDGSPIWSKVVSVAVATLVAWLGNRYLTFRRERGRPALGEGILFALVNVGGLLIAAGCLFVSHYLLGFTSQLADNISGNVVGLVLGTAFRFFAYRWLVFSPSRSSRVTSLPAPRLVRPDSGTLS
jgi:putative flippase GtrA